MAPIFLFDSSDCAGIDDGGDVIVSECVFVAVYFGWRMRHLLLHLLLLHLLLLLFSVSLAMPSFFLLPSFADNVRERERERDIFLSFFSD